MTTDNEKGKRISSEVSFPAMCHDVWKVLLNCATNQSIATEDAP